MPVGTRLIKAKINSVDYTATLLKSLISSAPADASMQTLAAIAKGGARAYMLEFDAQQDPENTTGLWQLMFSATTVGTLVPIIYNPFGVTTFTAATPGYSGNVLVTEPDGTLLGGTFDPSVNKRQTFSCKWEWDAKPVALTTGSF